MIPIQLRIKNFLSYGPEVQSIHFGPYPLICLSGKNGHGKSALLDAITWALWGQARKISGTTKPDHGLLHLGQTHMMVIFDFWCNNTNYRVKREFALTYGKPYTNLEFGTIQDTEASWIPLSGKTIRATQEIIENTLRLSYDSFINSAFLRQGQSHEFSTKSPKERKEILAAILGLQEYEAVRKQAMERVRELTTHNTTLNFYQEKLTTELQKQYDLSLRRQEVFANLDKLNLLELNQKTTLDLLSKELTSAREQQKQSDMIILKLEHVATQEHQARTQLMAVRSLWREVNRYRHHHTQSADLELQKKELLTALAQHQHALQTNLKDKEEILQYKNQLHTIERQFFETHQQKLLEQRTIRDRLRFNCERIAAQLKQTQQLHDTTSHALEQAALALKKDQSPVMPEHINGQDVSKIEQQFEKRKSFYHHYRSQGIWITNELELLQQKKKLSHDDHNPSCPLCEQNLSASRKKFLQQKFHTQERFLQHRLQRLTALVARLKDLLIQQNNHIQDIRRHHEDDQQRLYRIEEHQKKLTALQQELTATQGTINALKQEEAIALHDLAQAEIPLDSAQNNYTQLLAQHQTYQQTQSALHTAEQHLTQNTYDQEQHQRVQLQLDELKTAIAHAAHMQQQIALQDARKQEVFTLCAQLKTLKQERLNLQQALTDLSELAHHLSILEQKYHFETEELRKLHDQKEELLLCKGSLELEYKRLENIKKEFDLNKQQIVESCTLIEDYQAIAQATSKDGVQALLIEQSLPEIEFEANSLLAKLTNNQAHIIIESLRDLKKGGTKETLDIKISDAAGIRPYELFSGGEAFRIDFALRIAISKLLARRAGTSLQTLIIDEGFGSQDEEGLAHIMDAIYKIQHDFSKVIIVSHLTSMKDNFPVHFVVEKMPRGSMVRIIEQE
ncbi:SMC family ATPase [Candidatus Dependentiae bacterium]|nr:SMC family ATPase [Candidatus Dependentiae bacterium]